ncbi:MAG TPA: prepilin-type N-terminal cleavage/methylation domain-containing protein [Candidatus Binatia bacterium]|nr:prepilin-type N-terminal cleavage/methylation domain-containing protein [Candidatus Binatia bacterium]
MTSPAGKDSQGFSLLELVVVLFLLGISIAIVAPNIDKGLSDREVRVSALGIAAVARDLRNRALFDGMPQELLLNLPQNSYLAGQSKEVHLPSDVKILSIDGGETVDRDSKRFYFFPNGSSLGGAIVLGGEKSASYLIRLEPLTGKIEVRRDDKS